MSLFFASSLLDSWSTPALLCKAPPSPHGASQYQSFAWPRGRLETYPRRIEWFSQLQRHATANCGCLKQKNSSQAQPFQPRTDQSLHGLLLFTGRCLESYRPGCQVPDFERALNSTVSIASRHSMPALMPLYTFTMDRKVECKAGQRAWHRRRCRLHLWVACRRCQASLCT